jgi:hypothetical protein
MMERRHPFQTGWWRRFLPFVGGFLMVATLVLAIFLKIQSAQVPDPQSNVVQPNSKFEALKAADQAKSKNAKVIAEANEKLSPVEKFVRTESLKVGHADPNPSQTHSRLRAVARGLGRMDIDSLKRTALNTSMGNDRRFLSVYLMAISEKAATAPALLSVALTPLSIQDISSRHYAEELMIRTQALEGLGRQQPGALREFLKRQDNAFLADQARRILNEKKRKH